MPTVAVSPGDNMEQTLAFVQKIARDVTGDAGLELVAWRPSWEGDLPDWRLITGGDHLRVQYVPEDLQADRGVVMARLMQEIFRALYSSPDLIEPDLRSDDLFLMLHHALESVRIVRSGLDDRPGLSEDFARLYQEQYQDIQISAAVRRMTGLVPGHVQFVEAALYEGRTGKLDPRVTDERAFSALMQTKALREKILPASSDESYALIRKIWPAFRDLYAAPMSPTAAAGADSASARSMPRRGAAAEPDQPQPDDPKHPKTSPKDNPPAENAESPKSRQAPAEDAAPPEAGQPSDSKPSAGTEPSSRRTAGPQAPGSMLPDQDTPRQDGLDRDVEPAAGSAQAEDADKGFRALDANVSDRGSLHSFLGRLYGIADTLASKLRKRLREVALGRTLAGLFAGEIDEDALPYYRVPGVGVMKEDLLPGRHRARLTLIIDLSTSMGSLDDPKATLYHASRALALGLKALALAAKNRQGIEVRVVGYNTFPPLLILPYTQAARLTDAIILRVIEAVDAHKDGVTADVETLRFVLEEIREDMKGNPDTDYAVLHIGDGNPDDNTDAVASAVSAIYKDPANAAVRIGNLAAGPGAGKMYADYKPHSAWAKDLTELGTAWAELIESTFRKIWSASS